MRGLYLTAPDSESPELGEVGVAGSEHDVSGVAHDTAREAAITGSEKVRVMTVRIPLNPFLPAGGAPPLFLTRASTFK